MTETYFGHKKVSKEEKIDQVDQVFSSVWPVYDKMNDVMSLGVHHLWKRQAVETLKAEVMDHIIDLACGSGDLTALLIPKLPKGNITCIDPNPNMLDLCKKRHSMHHNVRFEQAYAENLPKDIPLADRLILSFGLRNFTEPLQALKEMNRSLKMGGKLVIVEFNPPQATALPFHYDLYLQHIIPFLGKIISQDRESYQYLSDSINRQPLPDERIQQIQEAGFDFVYHTPLTFGIVGLFEAHKCHDIK